VRRRRSGRWCTWWCGKQGRVQGVPNARRRKFSKVKVESAEEEA
jgi:hypothetical protein